MNPLSGVTLLDPQIQDDPFDYYRLLHEQAPVYRMPETGIYIVSRFDDVKAVLLDHRTYSSKFGENSVELQGAEGAELYCRILRENGWEHSMSLQNADPPLHTRHRKLIDPAFNKQAVRQYREELVAIAHRLIDGFAAEGRCEFVQQFAMPMPGIMIASLIGLGSDELPRFKKWADAVMITLTRVLDLEKIEEIAWIEIELQQYLAKVREQRRREPTGDVISILANQPAEDGQVLSMREFQFVMRQLIAGGFETTMNAMSHGMWLLLRHPELMDRLRQQPDEIPGFVDEVIRFDSPVQGLYRKAMKATRIAGVDVPEGAILMVRYGAANRDAQKFACPHKFDHRRDNVSTHLGFGHGVHFCIGRLLAKLELEIAFEVLLGRLRDIRLDRELPELKHEPSLLMRPFKELHLAFDPA